MLNTKLNVYLVNRLWDDIVFVPDLWEKKFECGDCHENFFEQLHLKNHQSVAHGADFYRCEHCGSGKNISSVRNRDRRYMYGVQISPPLIDYTSMWRASANRCLDRATRVKTALRVL